MTNAELIQAIRKEIERLKGFYNPNDFYDQAYLESLADVESFLDTLESEKPIQDELEEEIQEYMSNDDNNPYDWDWRDKRDCARHFAQWGAEHLKK